MTIEVRKSRKIEFLNLKKKINLLKKISPSSRQISDKIKSSKFFSAYKFFKLLERKKYSRIFDDFLLPEREMQLPSTLQNFCV